MERQQGGRAGGKEGEEALHGASCLWRVAGDKVLRRGWVSVRLAGEGIEGGPGPDSSCEPRSGPRWTRSCRLGRLFAMPANVTARRSLASALENRVHPQDDLGCGIALRAPRIMVSDE